VDESSNETSQTFTVEVVDTTPPTFDTIVDQTIEAGISDIDWTTVIENETDNSDGVLTKVEVEDNVDYNTPGTYKVTVKLLDESLNEAIHSFNVEVIDTTPPIFDNIPDQTIEAGVSDINWITVIENETDNSDGILTKVEVEDNVDYDTPGTYKVTVKLLDESLNETSKTFNVEVVDTTSPTFDNIPDQSIEAGVSDIDWTTLITNETDNSTGVLTKVEVEDTIDYTTPGAYTVTVKVTDESLNEAIHSFNVEVVDTTPPLASLNPTLTTIYVNDLFEDGGVAYTDLSEVTVTIDGMVDTSKVGTYTLLYTIEDASGNKAMLKRIVHVVDTNPTIEFKLDKVLTTISVGTDYIDGNCSVFVNGEIQLCSVLENNVNTTASGVYTITYSYSYNNIEYTYNRYVFVVDDSSNVSLYYDLPRKEGDWA
jgi:P2-related tail formation protein